MQKINKWRKKTIIRTQKNHNKETEAICALQQEKETHKEVYSW